MSLRDAVQEIVEEMGREIFSSNVSSNIVNMFDGYKKQLRMALKASEGETLTTPFFRPVNEEHREILQREQQAVELGQRAARAEEGIGETVYLCCGGTNDGVMVPMEGLPPEGAKTLISGQVYLFNRYGKVWQYSADETKKFHEQNKSTLLHPSDKR